MGQGQSDTWKGYEDQLMSDIKIQTTTVPESEEKNATPIYRNPRSEKGFLMYLKASTLKQEIQPINGTNNNNNNNNSNNNNANDTTDEKDEKDDILNTGWKCFLNASQLFGKNSCLGTRPFTDAKNPSKRGEYIYNTYSESLQDIYCIGNGLRSLGIEVKSNIGIFAINRVEWMITHLSNWSQNYRTVALYDTLGFDAVSYIVTHAELVCTFVEKSKLPILFQAIEKKSQDCKMKFIIQFDYNDKYQNLHENIDEKDKQTAEKYNIKLMGFNELKTLGLTELMNPQDKLPYVSADPEDLAYIMYTSGTTGDPKGVMLSHRSFACVVASTYRGIATQIEPIRQDDRYFSYLPLAHSFEASVITCVLSGGGSVAFHQGDIKKIGDDWKSVRPTILAGVPRVFNKTLAKIQHKISTLSKPKQWIIHQAEESSFSSVRQGRRSALFDYAIWSSMAAEIGFDKIRLLATGAAPMPPTTMEFLRVICCNGIVAQGYGMTETTAISFFTNFNDLALGHAGIPIDNLEYRLVDAPECGYYVTDKPHPRGEVQMRGPTIMDGYYKNDEETEKAKNKDGWLSSGDIGRINPNGTLSIIDRRKNMFKTSNGEYVAAEALENRYTKCSGINQIWIYGNSYKSFIVAIIVPEANYVQNLLQQNNLWPTDFAFAPLTEEYANKWSELIEKNYDLVKKTLFADMKKIEKELKFKSFEMLQDIIIEYHVDTLLQGFNVNNDTLTPTFKLKRPQLLKKYRNQLRELYSTNGEPPKEDEVW